jgi:hypothetical protein
MQLEPGRATNVAAPTAQHQLGEAGRMIGEHFDIRTRIKMKLALDRICRNRPEGENHRFRRAVAENIIRCALKGRTGIGQLVDAGERAVVQTCDDRPPA